MKDGQDRVLMHQMNLQSWVECLLPQGNLNFTLKDGHQTHLRYQKLVHFFIRFMDYCLKS